MMISEYHIGQRIAALRRDRGLRQRDLAQQIGVSMMQVHKYESGQNRVALSRACAIAAVLGVSIEAFCDQSAG